MILSGVNCSVKMSVWGDGKDTDNECKRVENEAQWQPPRRRSGCGGWMSARVTFGGGKNRNHILNQTPPFQSVMNNPF